jgi:hypothetical protein
VTTICTCDNHWQAERTGNYTDLHAAAVRDATGIERVNLLYKVRATYIATASASLAK